MSLVGKSLYVLTPVYDGILTVNYHESMMHLLALCKDLKIDFGTNYVYNESLISRARNRLTDNYVKDSSHTNACYIDADIGFEAQDIITMLGMDKDILGVPCTKKRIRWDRIETAIARRVLEWSRNEPACRNGTSAGDLATAYMQSGLAIPSQELPRIGGDFVLNLLPGTSSIDLQTPVAMRHVGTGLLMVKRQVFEKFMKAYPNRAYQAAQEVGTNPGRIHDFFKVGVHPETKEYLSEDYWFIHDCQAIGYEALLCPWVKTTHMGRATFEGDLPAALASTGTIL